MNECHSTETDWSRCNWPDCGCPDGAVSHDCPALELDASEFALKWVLLVLAFCVAIGLGFVLGKVT